MEEIVNKVANSSLVQIDLASFYPQGKRTIFDLKPWLFQELILKENDFRKHLANHDWSQYQDQYVSIECSADVIIPSWAFLLISVALEPFAKKSAFGSQETLETVLFEDVFAHHDFSQYKNAMVIVKGCGSLPIPQQAYNNYISQLKPHAKSIMFGEPCSSVPLYRKPKK
ncbi:MAG: S-adenosylmethionine/arginine decarboxylase-like enzyme [Salibacteraceae bacterium]|jgi:S-adenosylmethionine/arginine decarboxylase-like enzyme